MKYICPAIINKLCNGITKSGKECDHGKSHEWIYNCTASCCNKVGTNNLKCVGIKSIELPEDLFKIY